MNNSWAPSESNINSLEKWGITVFEDVLSEDTCNELIQMGKESDERSTSKERMKKSGAVDWSYIPEDLDVFKSLLPPELIETLTSVCGREIYMRERPQYKENQCGKFEDISFQWHKDTRPNQHTLIYYLNEVDESTPHTQVLKTPQWRNRFDPRGSILGKLEAKLGQALGDDIEKALGSAGDVAVIRTNMAPHRAFIPKQGTPRKSIAFTMSADPPEVSDDCLFNFDKDTYRTWEDNLSKSQLQLLEHAKKISK